MANDWQLFDAVLMHTRGYFVNQYHAGTRAMIYEYVVKKAGRDVPPIMVSAALKILKDNTTIIFDRRVWWYLSDR